MNQGAQDFSRCRTVSRCPMISVVIPTFNRAEYLSVALESVITQDYPCFEVIVIDDGSTDSTPDLIERYAGSIRYVRQANAGPSVARNRGICEARGGLIAFLDSDDVMAPGRLSRQARLFNDNSELGLVAGAYAKINSLGMFTGSVVLSRLDRFRLHKGEYYRNLFATPTVMVRRTCFDEVGLFSEDLSFGEDWDMWLRIMSRYSSLYTTAIEAHVRFHTESIVASMSETNFQHWLEVIERDYIRSLNMGTNAERAIVLRCKRISYYLFNLAWSISMIDPDVACQHVFHSIRLWPLWGVRRYFSLARHYIVTKANRRV